MIEGVPADRDDEDKVDADEQADAQAIPSGERRRTVRKIPRVNRTIGSTTLAIPMISAQASEPHGLPSGCRSRMT